MNDGDRAGFLAAFAPDAVLTDDGRRHEVAAWADAELFEPEGRLAVTDVRENGRLIVGRFRSARWDLDTTWRFDVDAGLIRRLDVAAV